MKGRAALAGLAAVAVLAALAELAIGWGLVSSFVIPLPSDIVAALPRLAVDEGAFAAFLVTVATTLAAAALATGVGIPAGWLLYRYRLLALAYESWIGALFAAPMILFYPMFLVLFGRSLAVTIAMGFVVGTIPVVLKTREGLVSVRPVLIAVARSFNASPAAVAWKVLLPAAGPSIFTGIRLCLIYAMTNIVGIEFLANLGGLGLLVGEMYDRYDIPAMYAAIVFVILASAVFYAAVERSERWLVWR
ncbi:MAG: ABC transporter permease [Pseudomonadota bacterium]